MSEYKLNKEQRKEKAEEEFKVFSFDIMMTRKDRDC